MPKHVWAPVEIILRLFVLSLLGLLGVVGAYFAFVCGVGLAKGYGLSVMDWNGDGWTTPAEVFEAADIGERTDLVGSTTCAEYFAYKDGLPVKTVCPQGARVSEPDQ